MRELPPDLAALDDHDRVVQRTARDDGLAVLFRQWPTLAGREAHASPSVPNARDDSQFVRGRFFSWQRLASPTRFPTPLLARVTGSLVSRSRPTPRACNRYSTHRPTVRTGSCTTPGSLCCDAQVASEWQTPVARAPQLRRAYQ